LGREAKKAVSNAKFKKYEKLYDRLETNEDEKEIYRFAKIKEKRSKDFLKVWCVKSDDKRVLMKDEDVKKR